MTDIPVEELSFKPHASGVKRQLDERTVEPALSVKDFDAKGDGTTDDTAAIQACFNVAFGTSAAPHGTANKALNRPVYFPPGNYKITNTLLLTGVAGGLIFGAGAGASTITYAGADGTSGSLKPILKANGIGYSTIRDLRIDGSGAAAARFTIAFDLNWDNISPQGTTGNTFINCVITNASYGIVIGRDGFQADNCTFVNCTILSVDIGMRVDNFNALGHSIIGGSVGICTTYGIYVMAGNITTILGTQFASNAIDLVFTSGDCWVQGARTESDWFANVSAGHVYFTGIVHQSTNPNYLVYIGNNATATIVSSQSAYGRFGGNVGKLYVENCDIGNIAAFVGLNSYAEIRNTRLGDNQRNGVPAKYINRQIIGGQGTRTYDIEASSLTDVNFLYDSRTLIDTQSSSYPFTATATSPGVITLASHSLQIDSAIAFTNTAGALPGGLSTNVTYYVKTVTDTGHFTVSTTRGGAAVNFSTTGTGTQNLWLPRLYAKGDTVLNNAVAAAGSPGWICTTPGRTVPTSDSEGTAVFKALANVAA